MVNRKVVRQLAHESIKAGRPLEWFDKLYAEARTGEAAIPWADLAPNPNVVEVIQEWHLKGDNLMALKVGCGLGDDAEFLSSKGYNVTAFDISPNAIEMAKERFPATTVEYVVADLLNPPESWNNKFNLIWESYTLQVLPADLRRQAIGNIAKFVDQDGVLIVIARARNEQDPQGEMPWPLLNVEMDQFVSHGLVCERFDDYFDSEDPPVRRFRAIYRKT